jgi:hypothetical protein
VASSGNDPTSSASRRHQAAVVPLRFVNGLSTLELPAREICPAGPRHDDASPEAIRDDDLIAKASEPNGGGQTLLGRLPIARGTGAPLGAAVKLRSIDAQQPQPNGTAAKAVAVHYDRRRTHVGNIYSHVATPPW